MIFEQIPVDGDQNLRVRILNLETLIDVKEQLGSDKVVATLPILRRILEMIRKNRDRGI